MSAIETIEDVSKGVQIGLDVINAVAKAEPIIAAWLKDVTDGRDDAVSQGLRVKDVLSEESESRVAQHELESTEVP